MVLVFSRSVTDLREWLEGARHGAIGLAAALGSLGRASDPIGIYAFVDRVVFEPSDAKPALARRIASLIDGAPTLPGLPGLSVPGDFQGLSLLQPRASNALFFTDYSLPLAGIRDGNWKLIIELGSRRPKLFDLEGDPGETRNLAGQFPKRVEDWRPRLEAWTAAQKALVFGQSPGPQ